MLSPLDRLVSPSLQIAVLVLLAAGCLQICRDGIAYGQQSGDRVRGLWEKTFDRRGTERARS